MSRSKALKDHKDVLDKRSTSANTKSPLLCTVDLSVAPVAKTIIQEVADVMYLPGQINLQGLDLSTYEIIWTHVDTKLDSSVLSRATSLKVIATASTGTDHIDVNLCKEKGIDVLSIRNDYGLLDRFTSTAECTWLLLLACVRNLRRATSEVLQGSWANNHFVGQQLFGMTLGVIGVGRLGTMVAKYGMAFGMRVLGCDPQGVSIPGVESADFERLLRESDCISVHVHFEPSTRHLLDASAFRMMKDGVVLINTSRGGLLDEAALLAALKTKKVAAFGADVLSNEWRKDMRDNLVVQYALTHDNVVITPHIGGRSEYSLRVAREFTAQKIAHWLRTGSVLTCPRGTTPTIGQTDGAADN